MTTKNKTVKIGDYYVKRHRSSILVFACREDETPDYVFTKKDLAIVRRYMDNDMPPALSTGHEITRNEDGTVQVGCTAISRRTLAAAEELMA